MVPEYILHPSEPAAASRAALRAAIALAADRGARLLVLGTLPPASWYTRITYGNEPAEPETSLRQLESELRRRVEDAGATVPVEYQVLVGDLGHTAVCVAAERGCRLIIMGKPEPVAPWGRLFRTDPEQLVVAAPCPVLVVPEGWQRPAAAPALGRAV